MVRVKFCGMTNLDDCKAAIDLGVDIVGFVFHKESSRYVEPEAVRTMVERFKGEAKTVGVFVNDRASDIERTMAISGLDYAQVYDPVQAVLCDPARRITVYRIAESIPDVADDGLVLFDSYSQGFGGSGRSFDYGLLKGHRALKRAFIAGGINEENVFDALGLDPYGIDLVSAVEGTKGKKDHAKMRSFLKKVRSYQ